LPCFPKASEFAQKDQDILLQLLHYSWEEDQGYAVSNAPVFRHIRNPPKIAQIIFQHMNLPIIISYRVSAGYMCINIEGTSTFIHFSKEIRARINNLGRSIIPSCNTNCRLVKISFQRKYWGFWPLL